ncbi:S-adenosyl-L-methionine-dependent tRNA 4-demethylwyosine synthase TYW1-like isoform X2 [Haliotis asinina]|uniref:S-adenosyl-L-methionine-dependent tRNA 4-demethylwyosine synthase TYW1-like isoform X2 n=1 Tax=Haliotis asinina TaxID=109174 RepID=UPI0035325FEA
MLEKFLTSQVSEYLCLPVWTVLLATACLVWLLYSGSRGISVKKAVRDYATNDVVKEGAEKPAEKTKSRKKQRERRKLKIFYGTQTGNAKKFAEVLAADIEDKGYQTSTVDLKTYDPEDDLSEETDHLCVFIISTYTDGKPPGGTEWFYKWLQETASDFRVQKTLLKGLHYAVFGLGNSLYTENFNKVAKNVDAWLRDLSALRIESVGLGDENVANSENAGLEEDFQAWKRQFVKAARPVLNGRTVKRCVGEKCGGKCACVKTKDTAEADGKTCSSEGECSSDEILFETSSEDEKVTGTTKSKAGIVDLEDLGMMMKKNIKKKQMEVEEDEDEGGSSTELREMITPLLRQSLEKQGYKLIGSHSGVKLCRWTKSMLRGRGGCYKHTFYGIESHRCMETTPSLACANKCVFCWRHHTNPVGTEWKWKMDDADTIFQGALNNHVNLIKQFRGVPGVQPERFAEGLEPKHCALSLVGEPIMYPEINKFVNLLHGKGISSFLVTNAQFPDAIKDLSPVTQLYVSVDASTKESLKKIDRPLFRDYWQRFLDSLEALGSKGQRTVYRLTLVKAWNTDEVKNYASLVSLGQPDFIEVKGVTYCGESKASSLTMANVPWHQEVISFVQQLADALPDYEIASEHEHSNCILIAHTKFKIKEEWWTWIDYSRFHQLIAEYNQSGGQKTFTAEDYMAPTPHWAVFGASERGFDPVETRFHRKKQKDISGC